jgi:hypothetical protein
MKIFSAHTQMCRPLFIAALLVGAAPVYANTVTPNFTQGSVTSTSTSTQTINETVVHQIFGGDYSSYQGTNVIPSAEINASGTTYTVSTSGADFSLELVTRGAGVVEQIDTTRTIVTDQTTTSLSIFSQ